MERKLTYITEWNKWQVYRNADGVLEAWKSIGLQNTDATCRPAKDLKRVVTTATTMEEFAAFMRQASIRRPKYNPHKDPDQMKVV